MDLDIHRGSRANPPWIPRRMDIRLNHTNAIRRKVSQDVPVIREVFLSKH